MRSAFEFTPDELIRLCWLRAVEWLAWPAFLSQPLLPVLYIFYPVHVVLLAVIAISFLWLPFRHKPPSLSLATLGCFWVQLRWAAIPIGFAVLMAQHRYIVAGMALITPWLASALNGPAQLVAAWFAHSPSQVGIVQERFLAAAQRKVVFNQEVHLTR